MPMTDQTLRLGTDQGSERPLWRSIKRGMLCRCPQCGEGRLFRGFLKPVDHCAVCGESYLHQRADDLPPYISIVIVGHLVVGGYMATDMAWPMPLWLSLPLWGLLTLALAIATIQPIKGGVIGLQWALRMHGFGGHEDAPED